MSKLPNCSYIYFANYPPCLRVSILLSFLSRGSVGMSSRRLEKAELTLWVRSLSLMLAMTRGFSPDHYCQVFVKLRCILFLPVGSVTILFWL